MSTSVARSSELDEFMLRCQPQIREFGCVTVTLPANRKTREPALAYTVGLIERFRHAELLVFGLKADAAIVVISELVRRYVRPAFGVPLNTPLEPMIDGLALVAKTASGRNGTHASQARAVSSFTSVFSWTSSSGPMPPGISPGSAATTAATSAFSRSSSSCSDSPAGPSHFVRGTAHPFV
jgi:hypothetical protein